jgi:hypothetical protein
LKKILLSCCLTSFTSFALAAGTAMNLEGSCTGTSSDGSQISLTYYSDFDGCQEVSQAALVYHQGPEGLFTGTRSFKGERDVYSFRQEVNGKRQEHLRLSFANSTGQTSGSLRYLNEETGKKEKIQLQCQIRDYHYLECGDEGLL